MKAAKTIFLGIFSNLITMFIAFITPFVISFIRTGSLQIRLDYINTGLILFLIALVMYIYFNQTRLKLIRPNDRLNIYLVEKNMARHIPDPDTLEYLGQLKGMNWPDVEIINPEEFKKYTPGSVLPSIMPFCERHHRRLVDAELQNK